MNASPPQFQHLAPDSLVWAEIKKAFAVITQIALRSVSALHPVGAHELPASSLVDHQVIADVIEFVPIEAYRG